MSSLTVHDQYIDFALEFWIDEAACERIRHKNLVLLGTEHSMDYIELGLPLLGRPLKNRNDFSAFSVRPLDASHVGVSGIGINRIKATMQVAQLIPLTIRQLVYSKNVKVKSVK